VLTKQVVIDGNKTDTHVKTQKIRPFKNQRGGENGFSTGMGHVLKMDMDTSTDTA